MGTEDDIGARAVYCRMIVISTSPYTCPVVSRYSSSVMYPSVSLSDTSIGDAHDAKRIAASKITAKCLMKYSLNLSVYR